MKALRAFTNLTSLYSPPPHTFHRHLLFLRLFSAQPLQRQDHPDDSHHHPNPKNTADSVFDSSHFSIPDTPSSTPQQPTWDVHHRQRVERLFFKDDLHRDKFREEEEERRRRILAKALLQAALEGPDEDADHDQEIKEEDQKSLSVGIIGAPNAGKSALTNFMVGTKVAAVSRKTNTTTHEVLGIMTRGDTQICFFDTPGLMLKSSGYLYKDMKVRVESAWSSVNLYDVLMVIFDVHRHLTRPDSRVIRLIKRMGEEANPKQMRILCMNKVDLVEKKKDLLKVAEQFKDLPGYKSIFMISGLKGSGVEDLTKYLMEQAVKRPWDEDPITMSEEVMKNISLEVVREKLLDHVHQEIPYGIEHRLVDWKELRDGSLRIEQHFITNKLSQRKILVGKNGSKIGRIGIEANEELRSIFKRDVHLILQMSNSSALSDPRITITINSPCPTQSKPLPPSTSANCIYSCRGILSISTHVVPQASKPQSRKLFGEIKSSPATTTSIDAGLTVNPIEGKRRGLSVGGNWLKEPTRGLHRIRFFMPASSETQQTNPPEEEAGENPDGTKLKERRYHAISQGSKRTETNGGMVIFAYTIPESCWKTRAHTISYRRNELGKRLAVEEMRSLDRAAFVVVYSISYCPSKDC
ncbi:hypothetical protein CRYUN_Cryun04dG0002200 [Craigia yunnanensis]